ncbi:hypothetical protein Q4543_20935 [Salipiger sp. 1_MG-2023]|uniref:DUF7662 domain-containing protein n=1 Tax=Salipiger sp. 1_MG-2023 TaxID=3062665 RepID=UPI0026E218B9|nr:hypothetical protein [Salipiger sp. 1_MG-2023]MDO6587981.1 hypothetical protein [Salipiger sp. 1_MG-2023]
MHSERLEDVEAFYRILAQLPRRRLSECTWRDDWPERGVYFFFEDGEMRTDGSPRVVRIGTHGLTAGSQSTLWDRLSQHRGTGAPKGGNHRGSVFRDRVGQALLQRTGAELPGWGDAKRSTAEQRAAERGLEARVSDEIGRMTVAWLDVSDAPGPTSLRGYIERNAIALVAGQERPSKGWLGHQSDRAPIRSSGLWNSNHVEEDYDPAFLKIFAQLASGPTTEPPEKSGRRIVIQCAKSKRTGGWFLDLDGSAIRFVADPSLAPSVPGSCAVHPDDIAHDGQSWRDFVLAYNARYRETGDNPFGLHPAGHLYTNPAYDSLCKSTDPAYILSACWGLVQTGFLLPNYDVTFSRSLGTPAHALRQSDAGWLDFNMLPQDSDDELVFVGGRSYLSAFERLSRNYAGKRIAYHALSDAPIISGIEMRKFDTDTRTNWHYALAHLLTAGSLPAQEETNSENVAPAPYLSAKSQTAAPRRVGNHGKYTPLNAYLLSLPKAQQTETLSFAAIEQILETSLPQSSRSHVAVWWANGSHAQANAWLDAGFRKVAHKLTANDTSSWIRFERL